VIVRCHSPSWSKISNRRVYKFRLGCFSLKLGKGTICVKRIADSNRAKSINRQVPAPANGVATAARHAKKSLFRQDLFVSASFA
jgi:hypothetical protein